jgi:tRNA uridine 5-carboxymethylaminomethyl modification enzyme
MRASTETFPAAFRFDTIVIGGGHAGTEAAWAAANALGEGGRVALVTMDPSRIGTMSCNPAIGGLAKGQMVREIDALGGLMGLATDATGIQFRMLNTSKGAAVRGPRAQCDKLRYAREVQRLVAGHPRIEVLAGTVEELLVEDGPDGRRVRGVRLPAGSGPVQARGHEGDEGLAMPPATPIHPSRADEPSSAPLELVAPTVVLTTGTFMRALMHTGERKTEGGRIGEGSAVGISATLRALGLELGRLKTGTPPRLDRRSLDLASLPPQKGDDPPVPFSDLTAPGAGFPRLPQVECFETRTSGEIHALIRANLHLAPMYAGEIDAECGPRYCPSIEDKVVRFADRDSHHVFLEPETLDGDDIYCNGISTSLPEPIQERIVRGMPGCGNARILRFGYAVEYDMVRPHQIDATGEVKSVVGLFLAGQINGTSGYEEAGGQGTIAGLNAARRARGLEPVRLGRDVAYLGVMMDDLVTRTPREPYRMFTSRAEHRLLLRADNADERLTPLGRELGLVCNRRWAAWKERETRLTTLRASLGAARREGKSLAELALRNDVSVEDLAAWLGDACGPAERSLLDRVVHDIRYAGYVERQRAEVRRMRDSEEQRIPDWFDANAVTGLRREAAEVIARFRPATLGQASRLAGVNPADLTVVAVAIRRGGRR